VGKTSGMTMVKQDTRMSNGIPVNKGGLMVPASSVKADWALANLVSS